MIRGDLEEAVDLTKLVTGNLRGTSTRVFDVSAADLRRTCGAFDAVAEELLGGIGVGQAMAGCFDAARIAGASCSAFSQIRSKVVGLTLDGGLAKAVAVLVERLSLIQEARILGASALRSRDEVTRHLARMNEAFAAATDRAADARDAAAFRALVALHAALTRDLTTRSRPLPRMVTYTTTTTLPVLALSQRLYGTAERVDELIAENRIVHPLFAPRSGRALSS